MDRRYLKIYRSSPADIRRTKFHKHAVGARVTLLVMVADPRAKDRRSGVKNAEFEITQLLPAETLGFQYRIKNLTTGLESVVAEDQIAPGS